MAAEILSPDKIRELFVYDPDTGDVRWREKGSRRDPAKPIRSGDGSGYLKVMAHRRFYTLHRIAWAHVHGEWPPDHVDHINGDRSDNRISNLRLATARQNAQNSQCHVGFSGVRGVTWVKSRNKWRAQITDGGKYMSLGYFLDLECAKQAYMVARMKYHEHAIL